MTQHAVDLAPPMPLQVGIRRRLTPAERGGKHASPKPEAVLKWAHTPIGMLAGLVVGG